MKTLLALLLMFITSLAYADNEVTWSWTAPTTNEDGSPLTDLAGFFMYFNGVKDPTMLAHGVNTLIKTFPPGAICGEVTAVDTSGNESAKSNEACWDAPPGAPSSLTVTVIIE